MYFEDRRRSYETFRRPYEAFRRLPKTTRNLPKISEDRPNIFRVFTKITQVLPKIVRILPNISEDCPNTSEDLRQSPAISEDHRIFSKLFQVLEDRTQYLLCTSVVNVWSEALSCLFFQVYYLVLVFEKIYSCLFIPNCTRNHVITYTKCTHKKM